MTNEEVIKYAKETKFCCGCPIDFSQEDDSSKCDICEHRMFFETVIKTFETQNELVHCKDCKYCGTEEELVELFLLRCEPRTLWCTREVYKVTENDFCSRAERKNR